MRNRLSGPDHGKCLSKLNFVEISGNRKIGLTLKLIDLIVFEKIILIISEDDLLTFHSNGYLQKF